MPSQTVEDLKLSNNAYARVSREYKDILIAQKKALVAIINSLADDVQKALVEKMIERTHIYYSEETLSNQILMAANLISDDANCTSLVCQAAKQSLRRFSKETYAIISTRVLTYLTNRMVLDYDITVYRGISSEVGFDPGERRELAEEAFRFDEIIEEARQYLNIESWTPKLFENFMSFGLYDNAIYNQNRDAFDALRDELKARIAKRKGLLDLTDLKRLINAESGDSLKIRAFQSTSLSLEVAKSFLYRDSSTLMEITIPAGRPFWFINSKGKFKDEKNEFELLLPPCANMTILKKRDAKTQFMRLRYDGIDNTVAQHTDFEPDQLYKVAQMHDKFYKDELAKIITENTKSLNMLCSRKRTTPSSQSSDYLFSPMIDEMKEEIDMVFHEIFDTTYYRG